MDQVFANRVRVLLEVEFFPNINRILLHTALHYAPSVKLLKKQSDQGRFCVPIHLHLSGALMHYKTERFQLSQKFVVFLGVPIFSILKLAWGIAYFDQYMYGFSAVGSCVFSFCIVNSGGSSL